MGFFSKQPVDPQKTTATYLWTGLHTPGVLIVHVEGDAKNFSYGFSLEKDHNFVGGLKIDANGWTGPIGQGTSHYKVNHSFPGVYHKQIIVSGLNGDFVIPVEEIPHEKSDEYVKSRIDLLESATA